ncbi:MAG TPA: DegT/DnrJ/EryC1/StrS family aminotransferase [Pyrinomonadaceae bacterium]
MNNIPLVGLFDQYQTIKPEVDKAIEKVINSTQFVGGAEVGAFEEEFAAFCEVESCVGVANGTDAIYLALRALGIGKGDEVITVSHTFIATTEAITMTGATPVFIDIKEDTMLMDPALIEAAITPRTKAIIPVHLYGQTCEMDQILDIAWRHGLKIVEDSAQAHGARWKGQRAGSMGDVACFSFYPGKNLGAFGDAGGVVSNDQNLMERLRIIANHGSVTKYTHECEGVNSRLDGLQAAILRVKLRQLDEWNARRRAHAAYYIEALAESGLIPVAVHPNAEPVWHLFVVRSTERDELQKRLGEQGIATGIHYPTPLHLQPAYAHLEIARGALPVTERIADEIVSLPMYPELTSNQLEAVVSALTGRPDHKKQASLGRGAATEGSLQSTRS